MSNGKAVESSVKGKFAFKIFENKDQFRILLYELLDTDDATVPVSVREKGEFVVLGTMVPDTDLFEYTLTGQWQRKNDTGEMQFKASSFDMEDPVSKDGVIRALSSGLYAGIGKTLATRIYGAFGKDTFQILTHSSDRLGEVEGIGPITLIKVKESIQASKELQHLVQFFSKYGISLNQIKKIQKHFPDGTQRVVKEDPFRLCEINGFGFDTVDQIAQHLGTPMNSPLRIEAAVFYALQRNNRQGNLYIYLSELTTTTLKLLNQTNGVQILVGELDDVLRKMSLSLKITKEDREGESCIYLRQDYLNEVNAAMFLQEVVETPLNPLIALSSEELGVYIEAVERERKISLADKQKEAVLTVLTNKVTIITGGPGTGKTTILDTILSIYKKLTETVYASNMELLPTPLLLAPTGRAARRMSDSTKNEAFTIHKGLGISPNFENDYYSEGEGMVTENTGIVFVDEMSMTDMSVWARLLLEIPINAQLVIIGDVDQLPSVGPGLVLSNLIDSGIVPVVRLDVIYRQGKTSVIVKNAHKMVKGETNLEISKSQFAFFPIPFKTPDNDTDEEVERVLVDLYLRAVNKYGMRETQILCPRRDVVRASARIINQIVQRLIYEGRNTVCYSFSSQRRFYIGDRVMQTRNVDGKASNGDMGIITHLEPDPENDKAYIATIIFDYMDDNESVRYYSEDFDNLELGYAITCHKSQGCEFRAVFIPVLDSQRYMLRRNLLYTAVTRGKEFVGLVGQSSALKYGIETQDATKRKTRYTERLQEKVIV